MQYLGELAKNWRPLLAATLATLMTGCVAGVFSTAENVILGPPPPPAAAPAP